MNLDARLDHWRSEIDRALEGYLPAEGSPPLSLHRAMRYAVFAGGKRLRPILTLAASEAVGAEGHLALPCACAIEMVHTYSLVHDDLPSMDNDSLRRGKPTTHVVFGEALAILAGDALLTRAMEMLATEPPGDAMAPRRTQVLSLVARAAGAAGMIGGQADDLAAGAIAGSAASERLISIHRRKTGALITASVLAGAVIAGAGEEIERLRRYGEAIGLAFQIVDDILDVESTTAVLGKSAGKDARDLKLTFPAVLGPAESRRRAEKLCREAQAEARALGPRAAPLGDLAAFVMARKN